MLLTFPSPEVSGLVVCVNGGLWRSLFFSVVFVDEGGTRFESGVQLRTRSILFFRNTPPCVRPSRTYPRAVLDMDHVFHRILAEGVASIKPDASWLNLVYLLQMSSGAWIPRATPARRSKVTTCLAMVKGSYNTALIVRLASNAAEDVKTRGSQEGAGIS